MPTQQVGWSRKQTYKKSGKIDLSLTSEYPPKKQFAARFGIRLKVVLVLVSVLLFVIGVGGWASFQEQKADGLAEINRRGTDISRFVAKSLSFSVVGYDYHTIQLLLDQIALSNDVRYVRVNSIKGNIMGEAGKLPSSEPNSSGVAFFDQEIIIDNQVVGHLTLGLDTHAIVKRLESENLTLLKRRVVIICFIALIEYIALSIVIIRPVRRITEALEKGVDEKGELIDDIPVTTGDELGQLADQFNLVHKQLYKSNQALLTKVQSSDQQLLETNLQLKRQSEELIRMNEEFRKLSITDPLTGLYNRRYFENVMKDELALAGRHGGTHSVFIIDIDFFKNINDTYGHLEGDRVLQIFASTMKENLRSTDVLCRMGGEEFIILCRHSHANEVGGVAEKFRKCIERKKFRFGADEVRLTVSIGATTFPKGPDDTIDEIFREADEALYYCKQNGRNQSMVFSRISTASEENQDNQGAAATRPHREVTNGDQE